ncbi:MAG: hypothetical protein QOJ45_2067 [Verrucomicrobiota bacterium]|jgi:hypothetical protein
MKLLWMSTVAAVLVVASSHAEPVGGQVFIVTNGHQTVKLALVPVSAFDAATVRQMCEEFGKSSASEGNKFIDSTEKPIRELKARADQYHRAIVNREVDLSYFPKESAAYKLRRECAQLSTDALDYLGYLISGTRLFEHLPAPIASTKTDADGNFTIEVPYRDAVVLVAATNRRVFDKTETYHWLVPLEATSGRVMLSNDNLTSAYPAGSPYHWVEPERDPPSLQSINQRLAKLQRDLATATSGPGVKKR